MWNSNSYCFGDAHIELLGMSSTMCNVFSQRCVELPSKKNDVIEANREASHAEMVRRYPEFFGPNRCVDVLKTYRLKVDYFEGMKICRFPSHTSYWIGDKFLGISAAMVLGVPARL